MLIGHWLKMHLLCEIDVPAKVFDIVEKPGFNKLDGTGVDTGSRLACEARVNVKEKSRARASSQRTSRERAPYDRDLAVLQELRNRHTH